MILSEDPCLLRRAAHLAGRPAMIVLAMALAGCTALSEQTLVAPQATVVEARHPTEVATTAASAEGPRQTGRYPSFGDPLRAANVQMENEQASKIEARLSALGRARATGQVSEAEYQRRLAELRRLAQQHGPEAEAAIAN